MVATENRLFRITATVCPRQAAGWLASLLAPGEEFRQPFCRAGEKQQRSAKNGADRRNKGKNGPIGAADVSSFQIASIGLVT